MGWSEAVRRKVCHSSVAALLALTCHAAAQECTYELEPNDTPAQATHITAASATQGTVPADGTVTATACIAGTLSSGDQDAFWWEVDEASAAHRWVIDIESYPGHLTQLDILRISFAPNGVDVTDVEALYRFGTRDGSRSTSGEFLVAPGSYLLAVSTSGGAGEYRAQLRPVVAFTMGNAAASRLIGTFALGLDQAAGPHELVWEIPATEAGPGWRLEVGAALGERLRTVLRSDVAILKDETTALGAGFAWTDLDLSAGVYRLEVSPGSSRSAPISLIADRDEPTSDAGEREPNDSWETANSLPTNEPLSGRLTANDTDMYRFRSEGALAEQLYDLVIASDVVVEVVLYDADNQVLQRRSGAGGALRNLLLAEGDYGFSIAGSEGSYQLSFRLAGSTQPGVEREPNDTAASAQPLDDSLTIRGHLTLNDVDMFRFAVPEGGASYRLQVLGQGSGLERVVLRHLDGREVESAVAEGSRARIDEVSLAAGGYLVSVEGRDSEYALRLLNLGEVVEPEPALEARTDSEDEAALEVTTVAAPLPQPTPTVESVAVGPATTERQDACIPPTPQAGAGEREVLHYVGAAALLCGEHLNTVVAGDVVMLDPESATFRFIWVPASLRGSVIKIDTDTGEVVGEYWTAPVYNPERPSGDPSRTVVDRDGNVWVGNRADSHEDRGAVVKIGLLENAQCEDRNGNGTIDTSTGLGDLLPWTNAGDADRRGGVSTAEDECILLYLRVNSDGIRHVSIDGDGNVWVSGTSGRLMDLIDSSSGEIIRTDGVNCGGYGGLVDRAGVLWSARPLLRWDPGEPLTREACLNEASYGIGLDYDDHVWISDFARSVCRFSHEGEIEHCFDAGEGVGNSRGVAVTRDGNIWLVHTSGSAVTRFAPDGTIVARIGVGSGPTGVSVDARGKPWVVSQGAAHRIDPVTNQIDLDVDLDAAYRTGADILPAYQQARSYVYSDMTGQLAFGPPDSGTYSLRVRGTSFRTSWGQVRFEADVPAGSSLEVRVSTSDGLAAAGGLAAVHSGDTIGLEGQYLYLDVSMTRSPSGESPRLHSLQVEALPVPLADGAIRVEARPDLVASSNAIEVILDASGSMGQRLPSGETRWVAARNALSAMAENAFPAGVPVALRAYGHLQPTSCNMALELGLVPFDPAEFQRVIAGIDPKLLSQTPLAEAILAAGEDLAHVEGQRMVVLVTDGEESCGGDPEGAILSLRERGIATVNIIGFALQDEAVKAQFLRWAELGGGVYLDTATGDELGDALNRVLQPEFVVLDPDGVEVGRGRVNSEPVAVPSGIYRVQVLSTPGRLVEGVQVVERLVGLTVSLRDE
ncbi:MAG: VWA domain-containing protein [Trueperaceae bacterium]|nr:VWA domain-containing protein [Trueperaceae bacterium]